ncbi:MAG TPA: carboxypeptidase regulatory-like domain-containing protein [Pirellulales bacterium]|nr:carboxypeptidase regulatory-like domain-containing protein [Pirellulales bacterium]
MRHLRKVGWAIAASFLFAGTLHAAVIKGRVVDGAGQPIAGAELGIWHKGLPVKGLRPNEPVLFDGKEKLLADDAGRFETPDTLDAKTPVRVVARAKGTLVGRSGWVLPSKDVNEVDDIVLVGLRSIIGRVVDSQGTAIAGATIFNGDGHERVEVTSGNSGKFFLDGVPDDAFFLFAEKSGYRLTGVMVDSQKTVELRMAGSDEPIEPLRSRDPILSATERIALGHRLLAPYLEAVSRQGDDTDKYHALHELSMIDPPVALEWLDRIGFANQPQKENCRAIIVMNWMEYRDARDWEGIRAVIDSSKDNGWAARNLIAGAQYNILDRDRRREWLDQGLVRGRAVQNVAEKVVFLAWAAEGFWRLGDRERATALAREAEAEAGSLSRDLPTPESVSARLARAIAPVDLPRALRRLDQVKSDFQFSQAGAFVALLLAPIDVAQAEEVWNHIGDRGAKDRAFMTGRDLHAADFCFRVAQTDPARADRLAAAVESPFWRFQARAAVARAVGGEKAKGLLRDVAKDPALPEIALEPNPFGVPGTAATALAAILPVAERIDAVAARELFWQALSLRPPRPTVGLLDDEWLRADVALAQMVARYEPAVARRLLERAIECLPQLASPAESAQRAMPVVVASAFVDPDWACEVLDRLPEPPDVSWQRHPKNQARLFLVRMLGWQGTEYWRRAGFWEPQE